VREGRGSGLRVFELVGVEGWAAGGGAHGSRSLRLIGARALIASRRHRPFVSFVAQTGLRIGEAIAVQWRDVDLDAGLLHIRRRYYRSAYAPPKTRYGRRVLPLNPDSTRARVLKPAASRAAVPWASWHTLRHACGTLLFREGWSIKAVQHYLGHHSAAFTLAVYVHFLPGDMPSNAFLDGIVGTPGPPSAAEEWANLDVRNSTSDT
jgi:integrase